jgi:PqqD family protein of HPr-rel-A system
MATWILRPDLELVCYALDDRWCLYHGRANETHFLNELGALLIQHLQVATDLETLLERLSAEGTGLTRSELLIPVQQLLNRFDELGLIVSLSMSS